MLFWLLPGLFDPFASREKVLGCGFGCGAGDATSGVGWARRKPCCVLWDLVQLWDPSKMGRIMQEGGGEKKINICVPV